MNKPNGKLKMNKLKRFKNEFRTMLPPNYQKFCKSTDDYFDLIKYCWECIDDVKQASFESFFPVEVLNVNVVSPDIPPDFIFPLKV